MKTFAEMILRWLFWRPPRCMHETVHRILYAFSKVSVILLIAAFPSFSGVHGDSVVSGSGKQAGKISSLPTADDAARRYMFNDAIVALRDGSMLRGLFAGVSSDSISIWQPRTIRKFGLDQIRTLRVESVGRPGVAGLYGVIIGGYVGFLIGGLAGRNHVYYQEDRPFLFITKGSDSPWILAGLGAAVGGGIAYWIASDVSQTFFDFSGDEGARQSEIDRLQGTGSASRPTKFHIRLSAGSVDLKTESPKNVHVGEYGLWGGERSSITAFRRAMVTYSIVPWAEVGLGYVDFSEPSLSNHGVKGDTSVTSEQSSRNKLFCVAGQVKPLNSVLPSGVSWDVGVGIGLASVDYRSSVSTPFWWGANSLYSDEKINSSNFAIMLFTGITFFVDESISVGMVADYTVAPAIKVRSEPTLGLDSRRLGNMCLGLEIGVHF